jgi:hypoxanthine phosphoribosyltransferase
MKKIVVQGKEFELSILSVNIKRSIERLAVEINEDYAGKDIMFICILNGSCIFASDLIRKIKLPCQISFIKMTSYIGKESTGTVKEIIGLNEDISGRDVIILEDIVDSGMTIETVSSKLKTKHPASLKIATLLFKPQAYQKNLNLDYVGIEMPNGFLIGYGLDYNGYGRNLEDIYVLKET